jgi:hypothetical protein
MNVLLAAALFWSAPVLAESPLEAHVTVSAPAGLEFQAICRASGLPCALELDRAAAGDPRSRSEFRADDETISAALSRAILLYPGHRWRLRKGIVYVTPNVPIGSSPLDRPLGRTKFTESLDAVRSEFGPQAGFCAAPRAEGDAESRARAEKKVSFEVADATATPRAVLNGLVFHRGRAAWIVERALSAKTSIFCLDLVDYDD